MRKKYSWFGTGTHRVCGRFRVVALTLTKILQTLRYAK
jgi:hypothetical protein